MLLIAQTQCIAGVYFCGQKYEAVSQPSWSHNERSPVLSRLRTQLAEYFRGERDGFDVPLAPCGTLFQRRVWDALLQIAYGHTMSYGALAETIAMRDSVRAVGAAVGRNPISVLIPCHRVLGADGALTGYAGGLERKRYLLALEAARTPGGREGNGQLRLALPMQATV
jgi:methylated-DNA-[protein]-cysteine S-methyltransferase